jgi:putative DNA primase/helicase
MDISLDLYALARAFGGDVHQDAVLVPGPDRGPDDRSLAVRLDPGGPDGFLVLSFAGDDPIRCKEHVRAKLGLPAPQPRPAEMPRPAAPHANGAYFKATHDRALVVQRAADVEMRSLEWLWPARIALGKLTLIAGEPGLGKSQLAAALAAAVTTGGPWPCGEDRAPQGSVVMLSAEDDASDTVVPRLTATGADLARVRLVSAVETADGRKSVRRSFNLQSDLDLLETALRDAGDARLVIIDPLTSYLGRGIDGNQTPAVRSVLDPLAEMAARWRAAVVGITHFSKNGGASAINRFIGSIAFVAAARAAFVVTADPESDDPARRLFLPVKNNLAPLGSGLSFGIGEQALGNGRCASAIAWGERVAVTAGEVLAMSATVEDRSARAHAEAFLCDVLADGPLPVTEIEADAETADIAWRTLNRAKRALGVAAERHAECDWGFGRDGRWYWRLPPGLEAPKDAN